MSVGRSAGGAASGDRRWAAPAHQRRRRHLRAGLRRRVRVRDVDGGERLSLERLDVAVRERAVRPVQRRSEAGEHRIRLAPLPTLLGVFWALLYPIWPGSSQRRVGRPQGHVLRRDGGDAAPHGEEARAVEPGRLGLRAPRGGEPHAVPLREQRDAGGRRSSVPDRSRVRPHAVLALR